jgi:hypothetical protein
VSSYAEDERRELRQEGITLLSVKGRQTPSVDEQAAWSIAEECLLQMGFPRHIGRVRLPLARVHKRPTASRTASWERLCWIARTQTVNVHGPHHRVVTPTYQRVGIVVVDANTGDVRLSKTWERRSAIE